MIEYNFFILNDFKNKDCIYKKNKNRCTIDSRDRYHTNSRLIDALIEHHFSSV